MALLPQPVTTRASGTTGIALPVRTGAWTAGNTQSNFGCPNIMSAVTTMCPGRERDGFPISVCMMWTMAGSMRRLVSTPPVAALYHPLLV